MIDFILFFGNQPLESKRCPTNPPILHDFFQVWRNQRPLQTVE
jgi:hypothetical protein